MSYNPPQTPSDGTPWNEPSGADDRAGDAGNQPGQQPRARDAAVPGEQNARQPGPASGAPEKGTATELDPNLDGRAKGGISGATWVALIVGLIILILLLVFILQNLNDVLITYMSWQFTLPLGVAMLLSAIAGALIMAMVGSIRLIVVTRRLHRLEKERESIKRTLR
ncbi:LapA family protein [Kocuria coralli]|uniref:LapA family protein n=1 Tax=Kocuria coralli TaxID=1461025 RepID=A0A5J5L0M3_9MICC|nr:LapA family protein [Kocuria coralli]KAA9395509.1 LapA family protein [Kocuria coralli]